MLCFEFIPNLITLFAHNLIEYDKNRLNNMLSSIENRFLDDIFMFMLLYIPSSGVIAPKLLVSDENTKPNVKYVVSKLLVELPIL